MGHKHTNTCVQETSNSTTTDNTTTELTSKPTKTSTKTTLKYFSQNLIIGISAGCGALFLVIIAQVSIYVAVAHQTSPQHQTLKKPAQLV